MKKIALSLVTIFAVVVMVAGATRAVFSSTAWVTGNTFSTGTLEIRVNGEPSIVGFTMNNAAPGDCKIGQFRVNNYGAPFFEGPSTLSAKELVLRYANQSGDPGLFNALTVKIESNRGWPTWEENYNGSLRDLAEIDLFGTRWTELIPGSSHDVRYTVCLPLGAGDDLQGKTTTFDFKVEAYNPHR